MNRRSLFSLFAGAAAAPVVAKLATDPAAAAKRIMDDSKLLASYPGFLNKGDPSHSHVPLEQRFPPGTQFYFYETVPDGWKYVRHGSDTRAVLCEKL